MSLSIATTGLGTLAIIVVMALVTLATRWGGLFIMSFIPIGPRVQNFISAMSGSVLIALLAPLALNGDLGARLALLTTGVTMLLLKKPLLAITAGIAVAAAVRHLWV